MKKKIMFALFGAFALIGLGVASVSVTAQEAPDVAEATEETCTGPGKRWVVDRCFTGRRCQMQNPPGTGWEATMGTKLGCSRLGPDQLAMREQFRDPTFAQQQCEGSGNFWSMDRCFANPVQRCPYQGKQGWLAVKDGVVGCSEYGPRNLRAPAPKMPKGKRTVASVDFEPAR